MKQYIKHWAKIVESIENEYDSVSSFDDEQLNDSEDTETTDSEVNEARSEVRSKVLFDEDKYFYQVSVTPETYFKEGDSYLDSAYYNITPNGKVDVIFEEPHKTGTYYTTRDTGVSNATSAPGKIHIQHKDVLQAIISKFKMSNKYKTIIIFRPGYSNVKTGGYAGKKAERRTPVCKGYKWDSKTVQAWNGSMSLDEIFDTLKDGLPRTRRKAGAPEVNRDEKIQAELVRIDRRISTEAAAQAKAAARKRNNLAYTDSVSGIWRNYLGGNVAVAWSKLKSKYGDEAVMKAAIAYDDAQKQ
jgi:hypothetical protein